MLVALAEVLTAHFESIAYSVYFVTERLGQRPRRTSAAKCSVRVRATGLPAGIYPSARSWVRELHSLPGFRAVRSLSRTLPTLH